MSVPEPRKDSYTGSSGSSENSDILDLKDDEGWEDAEPDVEENKFISLLDGEVFADIHSMLKHCKEKSDFDFLEIRQRLALDFYGEIKLINFIRSQVRAGNKVSSDIKKEDFEDERFLKPVLEDDAFLFSLDELPELTEGVDISDHGEKERPSADSGALVTRVSELEEELRRRQLQFDNYRATVSETLDERWNDKSVAGPSKAPGEEEKRDDDSHYFTSYSYNGLFQLVDFPHLLIPPRHPRSHAQGHRPNRRLQRLHLQ